VCPCIYAHTTKHTHTHAHAPPNTHIHKGSQTDLAPGGEGRDVVEHGAGLGEGHAVLEALDEGDLGQVEIAFSMFGQRLLAVFLNFLNE
jgi:hypothetical protein